MNCWILHLMCVECVKCGELIHLFDFHLYRYLGHEVCDFGIRVFFLFLSFLFLLFACNSSSSLEIRAWMDWVELGWEWVLSTVIYLSIN